MEEAVYFYSDGLKISAKIYIPDDYKLGEKRAAIVCIHGYSGRRDVYMPPFAKYLNSHGYIAMTFYHRGFGDSEGIRTLNVPMEQVRDIMNATTFIQQRTEVDPEKIGLFGTSFGGATATYAGAIDQRVKCIVEVAGTGNGERSSRSKRTTWDWFKLMDELKEDRIRRVMKGEIKRVPYQTLNPMSHAIQERQTTKYAPEQRYEGQYPEGYPLQSVDEQLTFKPESVVHLIAPRAILFIHTERDTMVPVEEARFMYAKAGEPKKIFIIPNMDHKEVYEEINPEVFGIVMNETVQWYNEHLMQKGG
jgi:dipeptidyl aminopeptidase/acylaminoacyl peptidase